MKAMASRLTSLVAVFAVTSLTLFAGCKPPVYPACESDDHCKDKGEVCINKQCQECRDDAMCQAKYNDDKHVCNNGRCDLKPECTADADCAKVGAGLVCRGQKCVPECTADTDCASGNKCQEQKCVAECAMDAECGAGQSCVSGRCQAGKATKVSAACRPMNPSAGEVVSMQVVNFSFDQYDISVDARNKLDQNAKCLQEAPEVTLVLEGHADDRGTQEYNLALGEKRANAVKSYLKNLGVDLKRLETRSKGENEPVCRQATDECWGQNRRVEFIQRVRN